ncbi:sensor histidine kinase [Pseudalkalibacillus decolorationis]|uniref:sensor histidine kinase n=1 Tax=Pseudalkalibacillus decolorationis TaxID=163879 RepID=UPI0021475884|nr:HAMP domain-containing sensor histidine kinase [Pseudalkalibacillus decolorationis]
MNIRRSLVTKYLLIVVASLLMWPILPAIYYLPDLVFKQDSLHETQDLEEMWKDAAEQLNGADESTINGQLGTIQDRYPEAQLFWVDEAGETHFIEKKLEDVPDQWTHLSLVNYMENKKEHGIYTLTAPIGIDGIQGFIVFQLPISNTSLAIEPYSQSLIIIIVVVGVSLVVVSLLFFLSIRKRLIQLQTAMSETGANGIPDEVDINNSDEIGQLEKAFNRMVTQLRDSKEREQEEERLRKQLIANISHDLRTPLTVIQQHAYTVQSNPSSPRAASSMQIIINKLNNVGKLLENLLTYTLLSAGKYPFETKTVDVIEELRNAVAEWYPVFEKEGFHVEVELRDQTLNWKVDPLWLRCIFENLFQNVIRHAKSGQYVGIETAERDGMLYLLIKDKGRGMEYSSEAKGAGIGLSIVSLMTKEMDIEWDVSSSSNGTLHYLSQ